MAGSSHDRGKHHVPTVRELNLGGVLHMNQEYATDKTETMCDPMRKACIIEG